MLPLTNAPRGNENRRAKAALQPIPTGSPSLLVRIAAGERAVEELERLAKQIASGQELRPERVRKVLQTAERDGRTSPHRVGI